VPVRIELMAELDSKALRLAGAAARSLGEQRTRLEGLARGLPDPRGLIETAQQRLDDRSERLALALAQAARWRAQRLAAAAERLRPQLLEGQVDAARQRLDDLPLRLGQAIARLLGQQALRLDGAAGRLETYWQAQQDVLARGYVIARDAAGRVLTAAAEVAPGAALSLEFHDGKVAATAEGAPPRRQSRPAPARPEQGRLL
jgi:exodeoxyribonuclease VII large subunit